MIDRRERFLTEQERGTLPSASARATFHAFGSLVMAVVIGSGFGALLAFGVCELLRTDSGTRSAATITCGLMGALIGWVGALAAASDDEAAAPALPEVPIDQIRVEELRVRSERMITLREEGSADVHFLEVGPRELLVVFEDECEDGVSATDDGQRFPTTDFVVVREVDSGAIRAISPRGAPLIAERVLAASELDVPPLWSYETIVGSLDDLPSALDAARQSARDALHSEVEPQHFGDTAT